MFVRFIFLRFAPGKVGLITYGGPEDLGEFVVFYQDGACGRIDGELVFLC